MPLKLIDTQEWIDEITQPLNITINEIRKDLKKFSNGFPLDRIPHIPFDQEAKMNTKVRKDGTIEAPKTPPELIKVIPQDPENNLHFLKTILTQSNIQKTFMIIQGEKMAKLVGLAAHFVYWCVLGHVNDQPLDEYHMKQLFISMLQVISMIAQRFSQNKNQKSLFVNFVMPIVILTIRV